MFRRILVPIDGSEPARAGLFEALALAGAHGAMLCLLYVVDDAPLLDDLSNPIDLEAAHRRRVAAGRAVLDEARGLCTARGPAVQTCLHELQRGAVSQAIVQQALEQDCDLIAIGSHGRRGLRRALLGSDAEAVLRSSPVPVLLVRAAGEPERSASIEARVPYRRLLVPVDGSDASDRGLDEAIELARLTQGRLRLVHVVDELSMALALDPSLTLTADWLGRLREQGSRILQRNAERVRAARLDVETLLVDDFKRRLWSVVAAEAQAWLADVIVLGSHGRRGFERLAVGSDAEQIVRHAPVPVLLVHAAMSAAEPAPSAAGASG